MRLGSTGEPFRWYISQPAKCGPLTSQFLRLPSAVRMNAPLRVPTRTRTLLMRYLLLCAQQSQILSEGRMHESIFRNHKVSCITEKRGSKLRRVGSLRTCAVIDTHIIHEHGLRENYGCVRIP